HAANERARTGGVCDRHAARRADRRGLLRRSDTRVQQRGDRGVVACMERRDRGGGGDSVTSAEKEAMRELALALRVSARSIHSIANPLDTESGDALRVISRSLGSLADPLDLISESTELHGLEEEAGDEWQSFLDDHPELESSG